MLRRLVFTFVAALSLCGCAGKIDSSWDDTLKAALAAQSTDDFAKAAQCYQDAIQQAEKQDPNDPRIATVASYYAHMQVERGKLADAELLYRNAIAIDERLLPDSSPDIQELFKDLAGVLKRESKIKEAQQVLARAKNALKSKQKPKTVLATATGSRKWPKQDAVMEQAKVAHTGSILGAINWEKVAEGAIMGAAMAVGSAIYAWRNRAKSTTPDNTRTRR